MNWLVEKQGNFRDQTPSQDEVRMSFEVSEGEGHDLRKQTILSPIEFTPVVNVGGKGC